MHNTFYMFYIYIYILSISRAVAEVDQALTNKNNLQVEVLSLLYTARSHQRMISAMCVCL